MAAVQEFHQSYGINTHVLSRFENSYLEANLFLNVCNELTELSRLKYREFFKLIKYTNKMEDEMLEANFIKCIVNDILASREYTLYGLACYTGVDEDVIHEIVLGININPSLTLARKIIELHRTIRPEIYQQIISKLTTTNSAGIALSS